MRLMTRFGTIQLGIAALFVTSAAWAAPQGGGAGNKGDTGGKGGLGPAGSLQSGAAGTAETPPSEMNTAEQAFGGKSTENPEQIAKKKAEEKPWEVSGDFETHHMLRGGFNDEGIGPFQTFNVLYLTGKYNITESDIVALSGGGYQYMEGDQGETGFRASDLALSYTRLFDLPYKLRLSATGTLTAPISFDSMLATNYTTPQLAASLSRRFGDFVVQATLRGMYFWDKYTTANELNSGNGSSAGNGSGQPNVEWLFGGGLSAEYTMPFHRQLSVGAAVTDSYIWYYNVGQCPLDSQCMGATTYPSIDNQPVQQSYGEEVYARYILPDLAGYKSDFTLAFGNGDPSLGYPDVIHDGVVHPYLFYYNSAEVYLAYEGRY